MMMIMTILTYSDDDNDDDDDDDDNDRKKITIQSLHVYFKGCRPGMPRAQPGLRSRRKLRSDRFRK